VGRKVHPTGFRMKIIRDWSARWYAEGSRYAALLEEDIAIRDLIADQHPRSSISHIEIERYPNQVQITLHTAKPGIIIGKKGASVKKLRQSLETLTGKRVKVEVEEVPDPDVNAQIIAENIAGQLERRISHGRAMRRAVGQAMRQGAKGVKIEVKGRLAGAEMARREWQRDGRVPLQTMRADIEFGFDEALTTYGRIGIKVWVYKGDILPEQEQEPTDVYVSQ
jgi:small subunit ribosomal protein S3